jgi:hypothetical protein
MVSKKSKNILDVEKHGEKKGYIRYIKRTNAILYDL